ncbi:unnamed protein product [Gadus morhua 'NCC']
MATGRLCPEEKLQWPARCQWVLLNDVIIASIQYQPSLNESSYRLLIGQRHAIPRDCLAEAERPSFHSQKHCLWVARILRLSSAGGRCIASTQEGDITVRWPV